MEIGTRDEAPAALPVTPLFTWWAHELAAACERLGLVAPAFRSPPAVAGADRTLRRTFDGEGGSERWTVAVRIFFRSLDAIRGDMIEGVLVANGVSGRRAAELREALAEVVPVPHAGAAA